MPMQIPRYYEEQRLTSNPGKSFSLAGERRGPLHIPEVIPTGAASIGKALAVVSERMIEMAQTEEFNNATDEYTTFVNDLVLNVKRDKGDDWYNLDPVEATEKFTEMMRDKSDEIKSRMKYSGSSANFAKYANAKREAWIPEVESHSWKNTLTRTEVSNENRVNNLLNKGVETRNMSVLPEIKSIYDGSVGYLYSEDEAYLKYKKSENIFARGMSERYIMDFPATAYDDFNNAPNTEAGEDDLRPEFFTMLDEIERTEVLRRALRAKESATTQKKFTDHYARSIATDLEKSAVAAVEKNGIGTLGDVSNQDSDYSSIRNNIYSAYYDPENPTLAQAKVREFDQSVLRAQSIYQFSGVIHNSPYNPTNDAKVVGGVKVIYPAYESSIRKATQNTLPDGTTLPDDTFTNVETLKMVENKVKEDYTKKYNMINNGQAVDYLIDVNDIAKASFDNVVRKEMDLSRAKQTGDPNIIKASEEEYTKSIKDMTGKLIAVQKNMKIPEKHISLLTSEQAKSSVNTITKATNGEEVVIAAKNVLSGYSPEEQLIVMRDLSRNGLPTGLTMLAGLDLNSIEGRTRAELIGNAFVNKPEGLKQGLGDTKNEINVTTEKINVAVNKQIDNFQKSWQMLDLLNPVVIEKINEYKDILTKATMIEYATKGGDVSDIVENLVDGLVNNKYEYIEYRNSILRLPKTFSEKKKNVIVGLNDVIDTLDVNASAINPEGSVINIYSADLKEKEYKTRQEEMALAIKDRGYFATNETGTGVYLMIDNRFVTYDEKYAGQRNKKVEIPFKILSEAKTAGEKRAEARKNMPRYTTAAGKAWAASKEAIVPGVKHMAGEYENVAEEMVDSWIKLLDEARLADKKLKLDADYEEMP